MYADRLPPQDADAEEAVIGSLLIDSNSRLRITSFLKPEEFSVERHKLCYQACLALFNRDEPINQVTLAHELETQGVLEGMGGPTYLSHLVVKVPTSAHVEHYARIVQRTAILRRLIEAGEQIREIGHEGDPDVDAALTSAEDLLFRIRLGGGSRDFIPLGDILTQYLEEKRLNVRSRPDAPEVVPTGFIDLDRILGGMQRSDLLILGARPSVGKSSLALNIAYNAAKKSTAHVAIFSLEMGKEQLADRLLSGISKIDTYRLRQLRQGKDWEAEEARLMPAIGELSDLPMWIDDTPMMGIVEMRSKARRLHLERGLDLVIVDYLQLMSGERSFGGANRVQELSEITRSLKGMARDLDVPVLALSQLRRGVEMRPSQRPLLSDLRESGSIEQDADVVMFIHREDMLHTEGDWEKQHPDRHYPKGVTELIIAKHRNGPTGSVELYFDKNTTTFHNASLAPTRSG